MGGRSMQQMKTRLKQVKKTAIYELPYKAHGK
jgi:hypothetical protein